MYADHQKLSSGISLSESDVSIFCDLANENTPFEDEPRVFKKSGIALAIFIPPDNDFLNLFSFIGFLIDFNSP